MSNQLADAIRLLPDLLTQHVLLCATALALAVIFAVPLAIAASHYSSLRVYVLAAASLVQTIPGLALLALFYPLLLGLSKFTTSEFGFSIQPLGFLPSVLALTLYSVLPILRNCVVGLTNIDPSVIEAANAVGMTATQRLVRIEMPLAAPIAMAGLRTAAVWTIGTATLSTSVGQPSLGNYIFSGLQTENWIFVLFGCTVAAVLALLTDTLLGQIEFGVAKRDLTRVILGFSGFAFGILASLVSVNAVPGNTYQIGAKNFSEQYILANLIALRLNKFGNTSEIRENLGSAIAFRSVANNEIDVYVDYVGTLWTNVLGHNDVEPREKMLDDVKRELLQRYGVIILGSLGFENAYTFVMKADRAHALNISSIEDLSRHSSQLNLGTDLEFLIRPEWKLVESSYHLSFATSRSFTPTFMFQALDDGTVDVISAFSSDGRIAAQQLKVLLDTKHVIPPYDAVILLSPKRKSDDKLASALTPLLGKISIERMREANLLVDRAAPKLTPREAAEFLSILVDAKN